MVEKMENKQKYVAIKKKVILVDINCKMLIELDRLEKLSEKYTQELKLVSKRPLMGMHYFYCFIQLIIPMKRTLVKVRTLILIKLLII